MNLWKRSRVFFFQATYDAVHVWSRHHLQGQEHGSEKKKQCVRTTEIVWFVYAVHVWRVQNHTVIYVYIKPVCWQTGSSKRWHLSEGRPVIRTSRLLWHVTSGSRMQLAARTRCSREASPDNVFDKHVSIHPTMWRVCHVLPVCACAQRDSLVNLRTGR